MKLLSDSLPFDEDYATASELNPEGIKSFSLGLVAKRPTLGLRLNKKHNPEGVGIFFIAAISTPSELSVHSTR